MSTSITLEIERETKFVVPIALSPTVDRTISLATWKLMHPQVVPIVLPEEDVKETDTVFQIEISGNFREIAKAALLDMVIWMPETLWANTNKVYAANIVSRLQRGFVRLYEAPIYYSNFNHHSHLGRYDQFIVFVLDYLIACETWPNARIMVR